MRALDPIEVAAGDDAGTQSFTIADLNEDETLDIAVIDRGAEQVAVLIGRGDGTFEPARVFPLEGVPTAVAAADLSSPLASDAAGDADGHVDLVVTHEEGFAELLLGRGDGDFDPPEQDLGNVLDSAELLGIVVADFDRNGRADLALLDFFEEVYFLCNENGHLAPCDNDLIETNGDGALAIAGGDFDGDTFVDVAVLNLDSHDLSPIYGNGDGSFDPVAGTIPTSNSDDQEPRHLVAGQLDDGPDDLVVANGEELDDPPLVVLRGRASRGFARLPAPASGVFSIAAIGLGRIDADRIADLVMITEGGHPSAISLGGGAFGFFNLPVIPSGDPLGSGRAVQLGDLNDDDRTDIVVLSPDGARLQVSLNETTNPSCAGDCDQGGAVTIDELILAVGIALGQRPPAACSAADSDASGTVTINELVAAVGRALTGCTPAPAVSGQHSAVSIQRSAPSTNAIVSG